MVQFSKYQIEVAVFISSGGQGPGTRRPAAKGNAAEGAASPEGDALGRPGEEPLDCRRRGAAERCLVLQYGVQGRA